MENSSRRIKYSKSEHSTRSAKRRIFILDPLCAQTIGHNLTSLLKYKAYFEKIFRNTETILVGSELLPSHVSKNDVIHRHFKFYYHNRITISDADGAPIVDPEIYEPDYEARQLEKARSDFESLFEKYQINQKDTVFFPSVDFYAVIAMLDHIKKLNPKNCPKIYLRFIGVMEYASNLFDDPADTLGEQVWLCTKSGYPVHLSAESSVYADTLSAGLVQVVAVTPVPPSHDVLPFEDSDEFVVASPGSARIDKGFDVLPEIISNFRRKHPAAKVRFLVQNLPDWDVGSNIQIARQIYAAPGVDLLAGSLTFSEIVDMFRRCHVVLMPYNPEIYALRSSAILTESVGYGRPVLTSSGTGFSSEVSYFNLGRVCVDVNAFCQAIFELSQMGLSKISRAAIQARSRYSSYCLSQYREWMR